ncbi:MAG: hypothetical protein AAFM91_04200 [Pseudomonadota bacterium]
MLTTSETVNAATALNRIRDAIAIRAVTPNTRTPLAPQRQAQALYPDRPTAMLC